MIESFTEDFKSLDYQSEEKQQRDGGNKAGQEILLPGERHRVPRLYPQNPLKIDLPDEGEDQDQNLHYPHHYQEAVEDVALFQRIVKVEEFTHDFDQCRAGTARRLK